MRKFKKSSMVILIALMVAISSFMAFAMVYPEEYIATVKTPTGFALADISTKEDTSKVLAIRMGYDTAYPNSVFYKVTGANEAEVLASFRIKSGDQTEYGFVYTNPTYSEEVKLHLTTDLENAVVKGIWAPNAF